MDDATGHNNGPDDMNETDLGHDTMHRSTNLYMIPQGSRPGGPAGLVPLPIPISGDFFSNIEYQKILNIR